MKSMSVLFSVAAIALCASVANAGGPNWVGLTGGAGMPTGDYSDAAATGWQLGATGTHMLDKQWGIGGDLGYHAWGGSDAANTAAEAAFGPGSEFSWHALQMTAHGLMAFPTKSEMKPYVTAGAGMYDVSSKLSSPSGDATASKNEFGYNLGAGMDMKTKRNNMKWGVAGNYHIIPASSDLGSDVDFFTLAVNVLWGGGENN
jgi:opacity protein-like surface antigen